MSYDAQRAYADNRNRLCLLWQRRYQMLDSSVEQGVPAKGTPRQMFTFALEHV